MEHIRIETDRLILRKFEESDMEAIYSLLSDEEVNTFLPWYPVKDMAEAKSFFKERLRDQKYGVGRHILLQKKIIILLIMRPSPLVFSG